MANPFDLERTLASALRPIDTLAAGTLQNANEQATRMFQVGLQNQRREQQLDDVQAADARHLRDVGHAEDRQDQQRKELRAQQLQDKEDDRAYQSQQTIAARKFQIGLEMLREDRQDKRTKQNSKEYFDRLDATTKAHIKQQIIEDQGISPKDGEKDAEFIQRAAMERHDSYKARAKSHVERQSKIDKLSIESGRLIGEAQKDLEAKVKDRASKSLASILKPDEAPLLNKLDPETVINQIASKEPARAQSLRADYAMFTDQAQKAMAGYVNRDLQTKLEQNQKQLRTLEYQQGLDIKSKSWDNIIPHVQDLTGQPDPATTTPPTKLAPTDDNLDGWMNDVLKTPKQGMGDLKASESAPSAPSLTPQGFVQTPAGQNGASVASKARVFVPEASAIRPSLFDEGLQQMADGNTWDAKARGAASLAMALPQLAGNAMASGVDVLQNTPWIDVAKDTQWNSVVPPLDLALGVSAISGLGKVAETTLNPIKVAGEFYGDVANGRTRLFEPSTTVTPPVDPSYPVRPSISNAARPASLAQELTRDLQNRLPTPENTLRMDGLTAAAAAGNPIYDALRPQYQTPDQEAASRSVTGATPELHKRVLDVRTSIYGGSIPTPQEEAAMRAAAIADGMTEPQMASLFHRAMQGDQAAINIARSYRQRVSKSMSGF